ncbi:uncharacterized protein TRIVIDRAFT_221752 [Trichoderma virens Gv29-8]|uniref:Uncharacterized protein n=1 Tax=Hypocrea virens (strain Gv29-8 / FGSC 10586) TaxID=413071 RepID=G9MQV1_HYPVG|nr:uncharacterized protein TRIVIDRAFT_221752 [Trichoderma virens Gv29-8]EHK22480.1 hypothetical protein TRIVIDRAFT_221752 [Trichoderma virens Gv29-8]UKZ47522.1 hypothetical protein TrVGV298_001742 [Trichoderma virens]
MFVEYSKVIPLTDGALEKQSQETRKDSLESPLSQHRPAEPSRKRSRSYSEDAENTVEGRALKRRRASFCAAETDFDEANDRSNPIKYWILEGKWPRQYTEQNLNMERVLARIKSTPSLSQSRKQSEPSSASSATPSDQKPREQKSATYRDRAYQPAPSAEF